MLTLRIYPTILSPARHQLLLAETDVYAVRPAASYRHLMHPRYRAGTFANGIEIEQKEIATHRFHDRCRQRLLIHVPELTFETQTAHRETFRPQHGVCRKQHERSKRQHTQKAYNPARQGRSTMCCCRVSSDGIVPLPAGFQNFQTERVKAQARLLCRHRHQTVASHAR